MKKNVLLMAGFLTIVAFALIALPSHSAPAQDSTANPWLAEARAVQASHRALAQAALAIQKVQDMSGPEVEDLRVLLDDEGPSWLGVETHEVTTENVKELKLPAERGVVVGRVTADSPAAKAGLKEKDVITEVNGQRVEGSAQFRRMIHEIPAGRTAQLTVWRDARAQTLTAMLGKAEELHRAWTNTVPGTFAFRLPEVTEFPDIPSVEFDNGMLVMPGMPGSIRPRLGIDAEDVSGQLGAYFGAPDGEGVLVRSVNAASPAEKSGLKAGDIITTLNGDRIRSLGDLRGKLASKNDDKPAKLGILRNKSAMTLDVELPAASKLKEKHKFTHSTNI